MSWALAVGVGSAAAFYYTRPTKSTGARPQETRPRDNNQKKQDARIENTRTDSEKPKKRKQPREQPAAAKTSAVQTSVVDAQDSEPEEDDQLWAQQLQAAKQGVSMAAKRATNAVGGGRSPRPRDDSPFNGASENKGPASQDVSDMLEPTSAGPSSIRITGEEKQKKKAPKKQEEPAETKKQRQNRKKVEERKAAREDDERERKQLEEKQRRSAREARGEPAKNGLGVAPAPANNAWTNAPPAAATNGATHVQPTTLLDTFDADTTSTTSSNDFNHGGRSPAKAASLSSANLPSEEEQMEAIREMNDWSEVKIKKGKKKTSGPISPPVEPGLKEVTNSNISQAAELTNGTAHKAPAVPKKTTKAVNDYSLLDPSGRDVLGSSPRTPSTPVVKGHPEDSDWAVE